MSETMRLRFVQLGCILLVLACVGLVHWRRNPDEVALTARHWIVIVGAIWTGISGFTLQRRILNRPVRSSRSTPVSRWKAGNLFRLWTATTVGVCAVVLSDWGGPRWIINGFFVISLVLLVFWSPGSMPNHT